MHREQIRVAVLLAVAGLVPCQAQEGYRGHGAASVSREVVEKYGPPPLDPEVSRRIQTLLDLRSPGLGLVAEDGKRMFFDWSITGTPTVWRLDAPQSFPVQMTGGEDPTQVVDLTPDGRWLVLSRDRGGQEDPGLYLQPVDGGPLTVVQHVPGARTFYEFTTADSRWIWFRSNDAAPDSYALYRWDRTTGQREPMFTAAGLWSIADFRDTGGTLRLLLSKATGALASEFYEWTPGQGAPTPRFGQGESVEYDAVFGAAADELLVRTNKFGEFRRLYRWREGRFEPLTPEAALDVSSLSVDRARKRVYYALNDGGYTRTRALDARTYRPLELPQFPDADHVRPGRATQDGRYVTLGVETGRAPATSFVYDWDTGKLAQWVVPGAPEVDLSGFAVARLEHYPARDGTQIPMFVSYPPSCAPEAPAPSEPCPVVVNFHGGPEGQARPGFSVRAQLMVDAGFVYVQPNVRGSDGYGKSWLDADNGPRRLDVIADIEDCARHVKRAWARQGKAPRVAITGGSYGGYSTLVGMTMFAGAYDVGVSTVGMSDLRTFLANTAPYRRILRASEYGDPERDAAALARLSPVTYLDRVRGPLLLIQGVDDPRVPVGEAVQMHESLVARGVESELILLEGEGHGAARRGGQAIMLGHTLRFLEQHLRETRREAARPPARPQEPPRADDDRPGRSPATEAVVDISRQRPPSPVRRATRAGSCLRGASLPDPRPSRRPPWA